MGEGREQDLYLSCSVCLSICLSLSLSPHPSPPSLCITVSSKGIWHKRKEAWTGIDDDARPSEASPSPLFLSLALYPPPPSPKQGQGANGDTLRRTGGGETLAEAYGQESNTEVLLVRELFPGKGEQVGCEPVR